MKKKEKAFLCCIYKLVSFFYGSEVLINRGFPAEFIKQVKQSNDIVSVISKSVTLEKKGKTFWACCPFHFEKTPSFAVNEDEQYYHCYGCGESGDVISFVQKYENVSFFEAVKMLAQSANLKIPEITDNSLDLEKLRSKERVLRSLNLAKDYYINCLNSTNDEQAINYLKKRKFDSQVVKNFEIGYSPDWKGLIKFLRENKIDFDTMHKAGLIEYNDNNEPYDVFATRLIFPIINTFGDCIGFTARTLLDNPKYAKYRNSTQTIVFDKSRTVYNINSIKQLRKEQKIDYIIVCEGTIDVIAMFKAGFKNAVACMGTAITSFHGKELKKFTDKVVLCLDGDGAGQKATFKAIDVLAQTGLEIRVVTLIDNLDPDEFLNKYGAEELKKCIESAASGVEFKINALEKKYNLNDNFEKNKFIVECMEILTNLETNSEREIYLKILSNKTNISQDILRRDMTLNLSNNFEQGENLGENSLISRPEGYVKAERFVLASIIHKKDYAKKVLDKKLIFKNPNYNSLFEFARNCYQNNKSYTISSLFDYFDVENNPDIAQIINFNFNDFGENKDIYFNECVEKLGVLALKQKQEELTNLFKNEKDLDKRKEIANQLNTIAKEIKNWR